MNVLVYDGPGVSAVSLEHTLITLRRLLTPNYTVQTIKPQVLANQPWTNNCALLVLPGGRDIPYISSLAPSNESIVQYVRDGGRYLGICAGAYYACRRIEWEVGTNLEVVGDRPLRLFDGIGRGCVYPGFKYETEDGARIVRLLAENDRGEEETVEGVYYNGGGQFVDAETIANSSVLARYLDEEGAGKVAAVSCRVGRGVAVLCAVHPEFTLTKPPASLAPPLSQQHISEDRLRQLEEQRLGFFRRSLAIMGLELPSAGVLYSRSMPQFLVFGAVALSFESNSGDASNERLIDGGKHHFHFHPAEGSDSFVNEERATANSSASEDVQHIILCPNSVPPLGELTPLFDISQYLSSLSMAKSGSEPASTKIGENVLYGEVITSTQTQLDQNPSLINALPIPLVSLASYQLGGRGRGSNTWLSSPGGLQFSILLRLPLASFPPPKLVFIQYLFGLAVAEACRSEHVLGRLGEAVRLKWPNDIYALSEEGYRKIGGILVNTSFGDGRITIIIGCGLNVLNRSPLFSLARVADGAYANVELSIERTAATIMATFEPMWNSFISTRGSFEPFTDLYLQRWLHSDQTVTLTTVEPPTKVTIVGITSDYGFLRTVPISSSHWSPRGDPFIDLQPDGNSFDMMAGLIRVKD